MVETLTREQVEKIASDYIALLNKKISIDQAVLYGSHAKGIAGELSDIDLLIVSKDLPRKQTIGKNGFYLDSLVGIKNVHLDLEVIGAHPDNLQDPVTKGFFDEIMATGKDLL